MIRRGILLVAAAVAVAYVSAAQADYSAGTGSWSRINGYFATSGGTSNGQGGGEFTWDVSGLSNSAYDAKTRGQDGNPDSFQSFCVELNEHLGGQPFDVVVNTSGPTGSQAVFGGPAAPTGSEVDPLDAETAYLYTQFATGVLSNYDYDSSAGRAASAGQLQAAIWHFEEGLAVSGTSQAQAWIDEATNAVSSGAWTGIGNVRILNNWAQGQVGQVDGRKQDMLYLIPTPAALLMGLPLLGLLGVMRLARRKEA